MKLVSRLKHFVTHTILAIAALIEYYRAILFFSFGGNFGECPSFKNNDKAKLHTFSLGGIYHLWNKNDYRGYNFHTSLKHELSQLSIPYTVLPLTFWLQAKILYLIFIIFFYPSLCLLLSVNKKRVLNFHEIPSYFSKNLLQPNHWLCYWLQGFVFITQSLSNEATKEAYELEKQHKLFLESRLKKLSTTETTDTVIVNNIATEGEMGIFYYQNGSDWVVQNIPEPNEKLAEIIPNHCSIPKFHVITVSPVSQDEEKDKPIRIVSCVLQIDTPSEKNKIDNSIYFSVDTENFTIENGYSRNHWYNTGLFAPLRYKRWRGQNNITTIDGKRISGVNIPEIENVLSLAQKAHANLASSVPLGSWVIQLADDGPYLERVHFLNSNWSRFANTRIYSKTLCSRLLYYEVKEIVKDAINIQSV